MTTRQDIMVPSATRQQSPRSPILLLVLVSFLVSLGEPRRTVVIPTPAQFLSRIQLFPTQPSPAGQISDVAYDSARNTLYCSIGQTNGYVLALNLTVNASWKPVIGLGGLYGGRLLQWPDGITIDTKRNNLYINEVFARQITVVHQNNGTVRTIPYGATGYSMGAGITYAPMTDTVYAAQDHINCFIVIQASTLKYFYDGPSCTRIDDGALTWWRPTVDGARMYVVTHHGCIANYKFGIANANNTNAASGVSSYISSQTIAQSALMVLGAGTQPGCKLAPGPKGGPGGYHPGYLSVIPRVDAILLYDTEPKAFQIVHNLEGAENATAGALVTNIGTPSAAVAGIHVFPNGAVYFAQGPQLYTSWLEIRVSSTTLSHSNTEGTTTPSLIGTVSPTGTLSARISLTDSGETLSPSQSQSSTQTATIPPTQSPTPTTTQTKTFSVGSTSASFTETFALTTSPTSSGTSTPSITDSIPVSLTKSLQTVGLTLLGGRILSELSIRGGGPPSTPLEPSVPEAYRGDGRTLVFGFRDAEVGEWDCDYIKAHLRSFFFPLAPPETNQSNSEGGFAVRSRYLLSEGGTASPGPVVHCPSPSARPSILKIQLPPDSSYTIKRDESVLLLMGGSAVKSNKYWDPRTAFLNVTMVIRNDYREPVVSVPAAVVKSAATTAQGSSIAAAAAGNPAIAAQGARTALILSMASCVANLDGASDNSNDLGFMDYPIGVPIGPGNYSMLAGAAILNPALVFGFAALHGGVMLLYHRAMGGRVSLRDVAGKFYFPSLEAVVLVPLLQPTVTVATTLLREHESILEAFAGGGSMLLALGFVWLLFRLSVLRFGARFFTFQQLGLPLPNALMRFLKGPGEYKDKTLWDDPVTDKLPTAEERKAEEKKLADAEAEHWRLQELRTGRRRTKREMRECDEAFERERKKRDEAYAKLLSLRAPHLRPEAWVKQNFMYFDLYRPDRVWFVCVEYGFTIAFGIIQGWRPNSILGCKVIVVAMVTLFAILFLSIIALRPYIARFELIFAFVVTGLQLVSAGSTMFYVMDNSKPAIDIGGWTATSGMYLLSVKAVLDLLILCYELVVEKCCARGPGHSPKKEVVRRPSSSHRKWRDESGTSESEMEDPLAHSYSSASSLEAGLLMVPISGGLHTPRLLSPAPSPAPPPPTASPLMPFNPLREGGDGTLHPRPPPLPQTRSFDHDTNPVRMQRSEIPPLGARMREPRQRPVIVRRSRWASELPELGREHGQEPNSLW